MTRGQRSLVSEWHQVHSWASIPTAPRAWGQETVIPLALLRAILARPTVTCLAFRSQFLKVGVGVGLGDRGLLKVCPVSPQLRQSGPA